MHNDMDTDALTPTLRLLAMGGSIAGGADEGEGAATDATAGDGTGGDGADGQQGPQDDAAQGRDGQPGDRQGQQDGEGEGLDDGRGGGRANDRIRSLLERAERAERALDAQLRGNGGGERRGRDPFKPSEPHSKTHEMLGGYLEEHFRYGAEPLAAALIEARQSIADLHDRHDFYADHPEFATREHRATIEKARQALSQETGKPWAREDVVYYLKGHPKFASRFVTDGERAGALDRSLVTARRSAGRVGAQPAARVRPGTEPDLSKMSPEERVKYMESTHGEARI